MKPMICTQCGGRIDPNTMRCEYCGTRFEKENDLAKPLVVKIDTQRADVLGANMIVDNWLAESLPSEEITRIIHSEITRKIVEGLEPYVEYTVMEEPVFNHHVVKGRIRVLPPGYRFD